MESPRQSNEVEGMQNLPASVFNDAHSQVDPNTRSVENKNTGGDEVLRSEALRSEGFRNETEKFIPPMPTMPTMANVDAGTYRDGSATNMGDSTIPLSSDPNMAASNYGSAPVADFSSPNQYANNGGQVDPSGYSHPESRADMRQFSQSVQTAVATGSGVTEPPRPTSAHPEQVRMQTTGQPMMSPATQAAGQPLMPPAGQSVPQPAMQAPAQPYNFQNLSGAPAPKPTLQVPRWVKKIKSTTLAVGVGAGLLGGVVGAFLVGGIPSIPIPTQLTTSLPQTRQVVDSTTTQPNWVDVAKAVEGSVVAIDVRTEDGGDQGSGVIIDPEGHIVTNNHVVAKAGQIRVTLADGSIYKAQVAGTDPATDIAVITLIDPPKKLPYAVFNTANDLRVGDPVAAFGNPLGLSQTMTTGIVSALERPVITVDRNPSLGESPVPVTTLAIQVDASINPGNSGGPLFDAHGKVIGINSSIATLSRTSGSVGLGFAIPADLVQNVAQQIIKDGVAHHAYLGVRSTSGLATVGNKTVRGAEILMVEPGTPAQKAGLRRADVIVKIDGNPVVSDSALAAWVRRYKQGDHVTITYVRDGKAYNVTLEITVLADRT